MLAMFLESKNALLLCPLLTLSLFTTVVECVWAGDTQNPEYEPEM
jgi:hypothetical protein